MPEHSSTSSSELMFAFRTSVPVLMGYTAIGLAFGLMMSGAGFPWYLAALMSLVIYAGAGQYAAVGLFTQHAAIAEVALLTLAINARHMVYGISFLEKFRAWPRSRPYLIFALTDETYALLSNVKVPTGLKEERVFSLIALFDQFYWFAGTLIGAFAGAVFPIPTKGLDFSLSALFVVLLVDRIRLNADRVPFLIGIAASVAAIAIFGADQMLLPALGAGILALVVLPAKGAED